jgi:hypothetical protein
MADKLLYLLEEQKVSISASLFAPGLLEKNLAWFFLNILSVVG